MRYSPEQSGATRKRVHDAAGRAFRQYGFGGVGVDGLAKAAGLTSGAFYVHFRSKADAFRAVVTTGMERIRAAVEQFRARDGDAWFDAFATYYLGPEHREDVAGGCSIPTLSADVARADRATRAEYEAGLMRVATELSAGLGGLGDARHRVAGVVAAGEQAATGSASTAPWYATACSACPRPRSGRCSASRSAPRSSHGREAHVIQHDVDDVRRPLRRLRRLERLPVGCRIPDIDADRSLERLTHAVLLQSTLIPGTRVRRPAKLPA